MMRLTALIVAAPAAVPAMAADQVPSCDLFRERFAEAPRVGYPYNCRTQNFIENHPVASTSITFGRRKPLGPTMASFGIRRAFTATRAKV